MCSCCGTGKCTVCTIGWILVVVGGLNWGLVGIGGFVGKNLNVVNLLLGTWPTVEWIVYILVGLATAVKVANLCKCGKCGSNCDAKPGMGK